ncbi:MAG: MFS transporter, partial [Desulfobacterales bacterium]|nr:MFS transporter [Desulfobacterales bacterium]
GGKNASLAGSLLMMAGAFLCLGFDRGTSLYYCFFVFILTGLGMGFITLSTLLIVQDSVPPKDLGIATSFHQFARTLGGTVGVGICGAVVTSRLFKGLETQELGMPAEMANQIRDSIAQLFQPEFQAQIPPTILDLLKNAVLEGVWAAFAVVATVTVLGFLLSVFLPGKAD